MDIFMDIYYMDIYSRVKMYNHCKDYILLHVMIDCWRGLKLKLFGEVLPKICTGHIDQF